MPFCPKCGNSVPERAKFCNLCGSLISGEEQPQKQNTSVSPVFAENYGNGASNQNGNSNAYANNSNFGGNGNFGASQNNGFGVKSVRTPKDANRSVWLIIILTLVTCGIYGYYFLYTLGRDVNEMCAEDGQKTAGIVEYMLLSIITCGIYSYYWAYKLQDRMVAGGRRYGVVINENGSTLMMFFIIGIVCFIGSIIAYKIMIESANKLSAAYNAKYFGNMC